MATERYLGVVHAGLFRRLTPFRDPAGGCRLSQARPGAAPEPLEISLEDYAGAALLVEGVAQELWIYEANVIEKASPIVTELVQFVLGHPAFDIDVKPIEGP
jgi:hypothetical protein